MDDLDRRPVSRRTILKLSGIGLGVAMIGMSAACSGGQSAGQSAGGSTTQPSTGATQAPAKATTKGEPIKIGLLLATTGAYADFANAQIAASKIAAKEIEDAGGVGGRGFEFILEDDKNDPPTGLRSVQKLIERDRVAGIIGPISSAVAAAIRDAVHNGKTINVVTQGANTDITGPRCSKYIFRKTPSTTMLDFGDWIAKNLGKRMYSFTSDYAAGHQIADANNKSFIAAGGEVVGSGKAPLGTTDFSPYMGPILDAKPDVVTGFFAGTDAAAFVKAANQFGIKNSVKIAYPGFLTTPDVIAAVGADAAEGIYGYLNWASDVDRPQFKEFQSRVKEATGQDANLYHLNGYQAAKSLFLAMQKAGTAEADKVVEELEKLEWEGPLDKIKFEANHQAKCDMYITQFRGGQNITLDKKTGVIGAEGAECKM